MYFENLICIINYDFSEYNIFDTFWSFDIVFKIFPFEHFVAAKHLFLKKCFKMRNPFWEWTK